MFEIIAAVDEIKEKITDQEYLSIINAIRDEYLNYNTQANTRQQIATIDYHSSPAMHAVPDNIRHMLPAALETDR